MPLNEKSAPAHVFTPVGLTKSVLGLALSSVLLGACGAKTDAPPASAASGPAAASGSSASGSAGSPGKAADGNAGAQGAPATGAPPAAGQTTAPGGSGPGAGPGAGPGKGGPGGAGSPPVSITSVRVQQRDLPIFLQATGAVTPVSSVDVRSQMTSVVTKVHIKEGQFVRKGEPLFTLDARPDEANVAKAQAQIARDEAALAEAQRQLARSKQLVEKNFVSQGAVDTAQSNVDAQTAVLAADKAALDAARIPLTYSRIVAPGAGRVGTIAVFAGSAVQANQTPMVTITQLDPIMVSFNLPQRNLSNVLSILKSGGALVKATLPETGTSMNGKLSFVDTLVDTNSGTVKAKAIFNNADTKLWPGAFVNVSVQIEALKDAIVVPQASIIQTVRGSIVYVIDKENKAAVRPVKIVESQGEDAVVTGLKAGERIALEGRQNLRPGSTAIERPRDAGGKGGGKGGGADKGMDKAGGKGTDKGSDKGSDKTGDKDQAKPGEKSADKAADKASGKVPEKSADKSPADKSSTEKPAEKSKP